MTSYKISFALNAVMISRPWELLGGQRDPGVLSWSMGAALCETDARHLPNRLL